MKNKMNLNFKKEDYLRIFDCFQEPIEDKEDKDKEGRTYWDYWWGKVLNVCSRLEIEGSIKNVDDPMQDGCFKNEVLKFAAIMIWNHKNGKKEELEEMKDKWISATHYLKHGGKNMWNLIYD